ncbi:MAG: nicotinate-nucleotide adenylyltransferase [Bacteroidia bacterium]|nr:nicotinate-nucleotide adenylyltransferase [Bacteroidia bacterium]
MKKGLFFGSFNPIHLGHLNIAQYIINELNFDKVVFIVSPQNPFKSENDLWPASKRLELIRLSIENNPNFEVSDIEFHLPKPSYTIQTLEAIEKLNDGNSYSIIMGSDTLANLDKWKNPEKILTYPIFVYRRHSEDVHPFPNHPRITVLDCPILEISATSIRKQLQEGKSVRYQVSDRILNLI